MNFTNQNTATWIKLSYYLLVFVYLGSIVLSILQHSEYMYYFLASFTFIFISCVWFTLSLNFNYIIFKETDNSIIFRYYPLHPFHDKFKSIEIPKNKLSHIVIKESVFGLKSSLELYQITNQGIAKYPPLSISALKKEQKSIIFELCQKYSQNTPN